MFNQPNLNHPAWKLAGMAYRNFYYSPQYWIELTGVDPLQWPEWFVIRDGNIGCTPAFDLAYEAHISAVGWNYASLGVRCC